MLSIARPTVLSETRIYVTPKTVAAPAEVIRLERRNIFKLTRRLGNCVARAAYALLETCSSGMHANTEYHYGANIIIVNDNCPIREDHKK
jgi:hypothetical protein